MKNWLLFICLSLLLACQAEHKTQLESDAKSCLTALPEPVSISRGTALIGNDNAYPEEAPLRQMTFETFEIDATEVTNKQFAEFVNATGYVTDAEKPQPGFDTPGGAVFQTPKATNPSWWEFVSGANWRHPEGPNSSIDGRDTDPVVQVSFNDALAYANWKGRRLPTEAEWEYAAKGGAETLYVWGEELTPNGTPHANIWQGAFPVQNTEEDGYFLRAPAGCFPPNNYGLYDMIGNVWEWTATTYNTPTDTPSHVIKGGSFLCAPNYCRRYRASARQPQELDFTTNHIGFRTVASAEEY